ncbi:excinuclease ABC subunit C [Salmonella enterica subsp. enterica]|uniref:Excinuclease ABC subunit C n=1 Tax=Salmonella enterica I TaxID=59201 RepID=A0A379WSL5_SALET|nr:excinuclease ABC subunit C [Salmonella enterica subsp. enterica]
MSEIFDAKAFLKTVTSQPGVYRMYDAGGTVIYVGKAKDLKKRLSSYFRSNLASRKTEALVAQIQHIDVTVTHTETEALLLEHNYIKLYQPRYNVLLRDDKSYPFIFLSGDTHPRLAMHRGAKHAKGEYFGPFPNGYAVRETLALLQKIFPIRQCENSVVSQPLASLPAIPDWPLLRPLRCRTGSARRSMRNRWSMSGCFCPARTTRS